MTESTRNSDTPFDISDRSKVRLPLVMLLGMLAATVSASIVWITRDHDLEDLRRSTEVNARDLIELRAEVRASREVLIRIDENVKLLKK